MTLCFLFERKWLQEKYREIHEIQQTKMIPVVTRETSFGLKKSASWFLVSTILCELIWSRQHSLVVLGLILLSAHTVFGGFSYNSVNFVNPLQESDKLRFASTFQ